MTFSQRTPSARHPQRRVMLRCLRHAPTVRAVELALRRRRWPTLALLVFVLAYALLALLVPVSDRLQRSIIVATHLRPRSMASWMVLQPMPKMYGFENRVFVSEIPVRRTASEGDRRQLVDHGFWVNHYPARMARFDGERRTAFDGHARYLFLRTRYRGVIVDSAISVKWHAGALVLESTELPP